MYRERLRDQNALSEEIVNAITNNPIGEAIDDAELEDELEALQAEQLDDQMLKTGTVPQTDTVSHRLPAVSNGESKHGFRPPADSHTRQLMMSFSQGQGHRGRGRRRGRAAEAASRDGDVGKLLPASIWVSTSGDLNRSTHTHTLSLALRLSVPVRDWTPVISVSPLI